MSSSSSSSYKLYYFDIKGTAEPIRMCLAQAGVQFLDIRIKPEQWPDMKPKMPFGQVPVLEMSNGFQLTQSAAILRYIGAVHGLQPDTVLERAVADELATSWYDLFTHSTCAFSEEDPAKKKEKFQKLLDEFVHPRLKIFDHKLSKSESGFLVGDKVTWADFLVYNFVSSFYDWMKINLDSYPYVLAFKKGIEALPRIREWHRSHPDARWSYWPSPFDE